MAPWPHEGARRMVVAPAEEGFELGRRGYFVGRVAAGEALPMPDPEEVARRWAQAEAVVLPGFLRAGLDRYRDDLARARRLMEAMAEGRELADLIEQPPYAGRLAPTFEPLAPMVDEGDDQEIETVEFDVVEQGELVAEGLWVKASWLSFDEADESLRFRFSFGLPGYEDVAADFTRQRYAAELTEALFPESALISGDRRLAELMERALGAERIAYVERIVYFNAPHGGAQMHQDVERGHAGVVYAQLTGATAWLALPKATLMEEIERFMARPDADALLASDLPDCADRERLRHWCASRSLLARMLEERDNDPLEILINRVPAFFRQLVEAGHGFLLGPGDVMLLPQKSVEHCAWHSVYCLGDETGEALSFAVRSHPQP